MHTSKIVKPALGAPLTLQRGGFIIRYNWLYLAWYLATFGSKKIDQASREGLGTEKINQKYASETLPKLTIGACFSPPGGSKAHYLSVPQC